MFRISFSARMCHTIGVKSNQDPKGSIRVKNLREKRNEVSIYRDVGIYGAGRGA